MKHKIKENYHWRYDLIEYIFNFIGSGKLIETNNDIVLQENDTISLISEKIDMFNLYLPDEK